MLCLKGVRSSRAQGTVLSAECSKRGYYHANVKSDNRRRGEGGVCRVRIMRTESKITSPFHWVDTANQEVPGSAYSKS